MKKSVAIIGGGIGGLCTAARLLKKGYKVTIYEKEDKVGGRANRIKQDGYSFDTGPTLLMMTDVLYDTFKYCDKNLDDYLTLIQLEPNYQVAFGNKSTITVSSNLPKFAAELARFDPAAPEQFYKYFSDLAEMYRISRPNFVEKNYNSKRDLINVRSGLKLLQKRSLGNLWNFTGRYFKDERLRQLFSFQSMYLGVSPYEAPAIYSIVSYMETGLGIWYPKGGMYCLSLALQKLVKDLGGEIKLNSPVKKIIVNGGHAVGIELEKGNKILASNVVANADLVYTYKNLIDEPKRPKMPNKKLDEYKQASSALLFYWGVDDKCVGMLHHNVYLSKNFKTNLDQVLHAKKLPTDPSFYCYIPTKTDPKLAPKGKNIIYVLVPVPNLEGKVDWPAGIARLRALVLRRLKSEFGLDIVHKIKTEAQFSPHDFETKFNLTAGSAFGLSHSFFQSAAFRPSNKPADIKNLYFVGASTQPGGGIPMVTISAKLAVERILADNKG